jgi:nucleotide-binding universal stress UspA family protein
MISNIKKILCPIDFTEASINAIEYAANLCKKLDASLTIWNMYEIPIMDVIDSKKIPSHHANGKQKQLSEILQDWCEEIKKEFDVPCGYFVSSNSNNLEKTLSHYTNGENFDLIIAGTNGIDTMYQFFFGTTSYRIIREVKCPVIIIPEGYTYKKMNSVVFATDYSLEDAKSAKGLIQIFDSKITFIHLSKKDTKMSEEVFRSFKNLFEDELGNNYLVHFEHLVYKEKLDSLVESLIEKEADMIILSTEHRNWFEDLLHKSFTKKVLESTQIPALVFHQKKS